MLRAPPAARLVLLAFDLTKQTNAVRTRSSLARHRNSADTVRIEEEQDAEDAAVALPAAPAASLLAPESALVLRPSSLAELRRIVREQFEWPCEEEAADSSSHLPPRDVLQLYLQ